MNLNSKSSLSLDSLAIDSIATLHNIYLEDAIESLNFNEATSSEDVKDEFLSLTIVDSEYSLADKNEALSYETDMQFLENNMNSEAYSFIETAIDYIDANPNVTFSDLQTEFSTIYSKAKSNISGV